MGGRPLRVPRRHRAAALVALAALAVTAVACTWSSPRGDLAGTGSDPGSTGPAVTDVGLLEQRWTAGVGAGPTTPVVGGTTVVVAGDDGIRAFDAAGCGSSTCAPLWRDDGAFGQPTIDGDLVYVARDGVVVAYDLLGGTTCGGTPRSCSPRWSTAEPARWVVAGDGIVVATGSTQGYVYATGDGSTCPAGVCPPIRRLEAPPCSWVFGCTSSLASIGDGVIAFGFQGREEFSVGGDLAVYDLAGEEGCHAAGDISRCDPRWTAEVGSVASAPAIVAGSIVVDGVDWFYDDVDFTYAYRHHRVASFGIDGTPAWSRVDQSTSPGQLAVADGSVFDTDRFELRALDLATGSLRWTTSPGASPITGIAESNGVIHVTTTVEVRLYDAAGVAGCTDSRCAPIMTITGSGAGAAASISNGSLWVPGSDGLLRAFRPAT